jgi:GNAT superfamily N-acetyltransferase
MRDDFHKWLTLWEGYNAFYDRVGPTALPDAVTQATWRRFFDVYEPMHALVAEDDGNLLGLVHFLYHRSTIIVEATCYLHDLFTAQTTRGKGVGRALISAVFERARNAGLNRVYWHTDESNKRSMVLYDQMADKPGLVMYRKTLYPPHNGSFLAEAHGQPSEQQGAGAAWPTEGPRPVGRR